jgi:hypothetical protein
MPQVMAFCPGKIPVCPWNKPRTNDTLFTFPGIGVKLYVDVGGREDFVLPAEDRNSPGVWGKIHPDAPSGD